MTTKDLGDAIGGFPIAVVATAERHAYVHHTGMYTYDLPQIGPG